MTDLFNTYLIGHPDVNEQSKDFHPIRAFNRYGHQFNLPDSFDGRISWSDYLSPIEDQKSCGSCYAFAFAGMMSDRLTLLTLGQIRVQITAVDSVICQLIDPDANIAQFQVLELGDNTNTDPDTMAKKKLYAEQEASAHESRACKGNSLFNTGKFLYLIGSTTTDCVANSHVTNEGPNDPLPTCSELEDPLGELSFDTCSDLKTAQRIFRLNNVYTIDIPVDISATVNSANLDHDIAERNIMAEIFKWGPIVSGYNVFDDFADYGYNNVRIYTHPKRDQKPLGGHAIRIVGWGQEQQDGRLVKYWIIANSWGPQWKYQGYFLMERWLEGCDLEINIISGIPELPNTVNIQLPTVLITENEKKLAQLYKIDQTRFYALTSINKIEKGQQIGNLDPFIDSNKLPDTETFIAGFIEGKDSKKAWMMIGLIIVLGLIILLILVLWRRYKL